MNIQEISKIKELFWKSGYGSINIEEAKHLNDYINQKKPKDFLEIGTASGFSGGLICCFLEENNQSANFTTVDYDNTFFGDLKKENGFLVSSIYKGQKIKINQKKFKISADIAEGGNFFDMAFIDANHMHPWPTLDTIALLPKLKKPSILFHHDYNLFKIQKDSKGIGPKYLFDQWIPNKRKRLKGNKGNLIAFEIDKEAEFYSRILSDSLHLPWTINEYHFPKRGSGAMNNCYERYREIISKYYDKSLLETFENRYTTFYHKNNNVINSKLRYLKSRLKTVLKS